MKLRYNTVEYNIKQLKEEFKEYAKACNRNDMARIKQCAQRIDELAMELRGSIKNGSWHSQELQAFNGPSYSSPDVFFIPFNKTY
jgi:t-SNARE complex subunit (syntaxin)